MTLVKADTPCCMVADCRPMRSPALVNHAASGHAAFPCCACSAGWPRAGATSCAAAARCAARPALALFGGTLFWRARPVLAALRRVLRLPAGSAGAGHPGCMRSAALQQRRARRLATALAAWARATAVSSCSACCWPSPAPAGDDLGTLITGLAPAPVRNPVEFLRVVMLADQGHLFEIWLALRRRARGAGIRLQRGGHPGCCSTARSAC